MQQNVLERMKSHLPSTTTAMLLVLAGAAAVQAQPNETFIDTLDVQVVEVDVVVTDRNGRPVRGLTRDDFELYVEGEPVEITNFFESEILRQPAEPGDRTAAPTADAEPSEAEVAADPASLTVVLYMDDANLFPPYRSRLLRRLEKASSRGGP